MNHIKRTFIETSMFIKRWYELNLTDDDLSEFERFIMENPDSGDIIRGTGGLTKIRWNLPDSGKRGGIRVLYVDFIKQQKIVFINCYGKQNKDNISNKEKAIYKKLIDKIKGELI